MLSYLHSYHAGNHADIIKHITLSLILKYKKNKDSPLVYIDSHAGRGYYNLNSRESKKTSEYNSGIGKLLSCTDDLDPSINDYLSIVKEINNDLIKANSSNACNSEPRPVETLNTDKTLKLNYYPGSPLIAKKLLRPQDHLIMMELHNNEIRELKLRMDCRNDKRIAIHHRDGFEGLVAVTPPKIKRGVVLIDPSYEMVEDYKKAIESIELVLKKWNDVTIMLWYPHLNNSKDHSLFLREKAKKIEAKEILDVNFCIANSQDKIEGMYGSGLLIFNPTYNLSDQLSDIVNQLQTICKETPNAISSVQNLK